MSTNKKSSKTVTVEQIYSPVRRPAEQRATLIGLGLNKMHKIVERQDTPEVRGMIAKVKHMVRVRAEPSRRHPPGPASALRATSESECNDYQA